MKHAPEIFAIVILAIVAAIAIARLIAKVTTKITVWEYEKALLYKDGKLATILNPGAHWICPLWDHVVKVDMRERNISIAGQELLSLDNIGLKISIAAGYKLVDANLAINKTENFYSALYTVMQLELREIVGTMNLDELLEKRNEIGAKFLDACKPKAAAIGLELIYANVKDIMLAGDMKKAFGEVIKAQKQGLAVLEKTRSETAALRSLANAAKMLDDNPHLLQLRALQTMGETTGNTMIMNVGQDMSALPIRKSSGAGRTSKSTAAAAEPDEET